MQAMLCQILMPRSIANREPVSIPCVQYGSAQADSTATEEDVASGRMSRVGCRGSLGIEIVMHEPVKNGGLDVSVGAVPGRFGEEGRPKIGLKNNPKPMVLHDYPQIQLFVERVLI